MPTDPMRRTIIRGLALAWAFPAAARAAVDAGSAAHHVFAGGSIQDALEKAAKDPVRKTVVVHEGTYRPRASGQALVFFNARHEGITLEAQGKVTLTAANPALAAPRAPGGAAVVNHVVYFGNGLSRKTVFRGFKVTGANNFTTGTGQKSPIEDDGVFKSTFFYTDGGGLKVYGRSYPTIENVEVVDNYSSPCGGGASVEHLDAPTDAVLFRNCVFRGNRAQITGSALDVLHGSRAHLDNCLFVGNVANLGVDVVGMLGGGEFHPQNGSGALTVFPRGQVSARRCTFTGNWNGADDAGTGSVYEDCIFWQNTLGGGICPGGRYELDITDASGVRGNFLGGAQDDLRGTIDAAKNTLRAPDPRFDAKFVPRAPQYAKAGYRPR